MGYQNTHFKVCLSSFGCEELKLPKQHIVQCHRSEKVKVTILNLNTVCTPFDFALSYVVCFVQNICTAKVLILSIKTESMSIMAILRPHTVCTQPPHH